jgi:hypothetical protein
VEDDHGGDRLDVLHLRDAGDVEDGAAHLRGAADGLVQGGEAADGADVEVTASARALGVDEDPHEERHQEQDHHQAGGGVVPVPEDPDDAGDTHSRSLPTDQYGVVLLWCS